MRRIRLDPRPDWTARCEAIGFHFHHVDGSVYWDESAAYAFTDAEIDVLEKVTGELHAMCLDAVDHVVETGAIGLYGLPDHAHDAIAASWRRRDPSIYGRFDLSWDGTGPPKLLEYNADTPTSLFEAAVVQWHWLEERFPEADQFNALNDALIEAWRDMPPAATTHFCCHTQAPEDLGTTAYLANTALQAGRAVKLMATSDIGWDAVAGRFVDPEDLPIDLLFKLYPTEMMLADEGAGPMLAHGPRLIEPLWKVLLSGKAILPILWRLFPDHPNLPPAHFEPGPLGGRHVAKPIFGREGANVTLVTPEGRLAEPGPYGAEGFIHQGLAPLPVFDGAHALIGSWIVGDRPAGIGMREDLSPITTNASRFVPHLVE